MNYVSIFVGSSSKAEQHEKTSSNIKHEKFVPSPEISLSGIEIQQPSLAGESKSNDNFFPMSHYYHPVKHSVHFHSSAPIVSNSNWKHHTHLESLQKNYPKFEDELQRQKEIEKFTFAPPVVDSSKWYFAPERPIIESTEKPSLRPSGSGKWKWVSDEEEEQDKRIALSPVHIPTIPTNEFSYTYEIPSTDSTPFSFNKYEGSEQPSMLNGEVPSTTLENTESEWESPFSSSNGQLKHKGRAKGKG